jgi:TolA-binding protein
MRVGRWAARLSGLAGIVFGISVASAQEVRRAQPVNEPPMGRPVPFDQPTASPAPPHHRSAVAPQQNETQPANPPSAIEATESAPAESESPGRRQLNYANALFGRKLYDLAAPEYEKFLGEFSDAPGRAAAFFYLGECYRALNRSPAARSSFQAVVDEYGESEFAGPAAYGVAEILFTQKDYKSALPLFHRAAAKTKESALALSARYFEARCLENLDEKDEARDAYEQVIDTKNPNPYRDDSRLAVGSILLSRGKKSDALKQYEALADETKKPGLKAEAMVRAGMLAVDLAQSEKGKTGEGMTERAASLLQRARTLPEAGKWRGIAQVGLLRLQYQSGQYAELIAGYKRDQDQIPGEVRPEMMLLFGNSQRQLGHAKEAEDIYQGIIAKYPAREEAKDAQYQRLINLYNSNASSLQTEVSAFLKTNPSGECADQAKLLQAEAFYKGGNFGEAVPLYTELRASQLSPKLRAEAAYKLGWCFVQMKDTANLIDAFGYFLQAFPDNSQAPAALAQRALAYQEGKNYDAALTDLNALLANYPKAREREAAWQQKALILGQQEDAKGMADAFRQLLKEFPKSAVAAQAHYYIGKAAFETKDYPTAISELNTARTLDKEQYYNLATLRIISSFFYLKDRNVLANEVNDFMAASAGAKVPAEILEWLGIEYYNEKNYPVAEKYLTALSQSDNLGAVKPDFWFYLGDTQSKLKNFPAAETAFEKYLETATDPAGKAKVLLALGAAKIGSHKPDDAQKIAEEIMTLQPEGRVNAEARLLAGDVDLERQRFDEASKAFMGVALLYDDPAITPRALEKAALAYEKAGRKEEADRVAKELHEKYPDYAGG